MDTKSLHTDASSYRINAIVVSFYSYFGALTGIRAMPLMVMSPSAISGISCSKSLSRKTVDVRERMILGLLFLFSTRATTARTCFPCGKSRSEFVRFWAISARCAHHQAATILFSKSDILLPKRFVLPFLLYLL